MADTLSRYAPQNGITRLPDLMDRLIRESFVMPSMVNGSANTGARASFPVNLFETPEGYVLTAALPGLDPAKLDITVVGREVSIKGQFAVAAPEGGTCIWQGIPSGEFFETYSLPAEVQGDSTQAGYEYGILTLTLPKAEHLRPKSIKVNVSK
jgi:HSP20 family protein